MKSLLAIATCIILGQYFWLEDTSEIYKASLNIQLVVAFLLASHLVPYGKLWEKSALFIFAQSYAWDSLAFLLPNNFYVIAANVVVFGGWMLFVLFRRDSVASDILTDEHVYIIAKRPDSFGGFLVSLFGDPYGAYAHYLKGTVFYYHKGKYLSMPVYKYNMAGKTIIKSNIEITSKVMGKATTMLKSRWSILNNCLTVLIRLRHV